MTNIIDNLVSLWGLSKGISGWEISRQDGLTLLKSPTNIPNLNLAIIAKDSVDSGIITGFFKGKNFGVISSVNNDAGISIEPVVALTITEMHLPVGSYNPLSVANEIKVVSSEEDLSLWSTIASKIFEIDSEDFYKFLFPSYKHERQKIIMFKNADECVGTGHIYVDENGLVYISTIGVLSDYRRKGLGKKIMNACMNYAKQLGGKTFALYASDMGEHLYKNLGFVEVEKCNFKIFA